jgi:hypothetical protein
MAIPRHGIAAVTLDDRIFTPAGGVVQGLQATAAADAFVPGDEPRFPTAPACPTVPRSCRAPLAPRRSTLAMSDPAGEKRDRLAWLWARGAATTLGELGSPPAGDGVVVCLYEAGALRSAWRAFGDAPACGLAAGEVVSRWRTNRRGFTYTHRAGVPDGIHRVTLRSGLDGKAVIGVNGKGAELTLPTLAELTAPVVVQLHAATGACWEATFGAPFSLRQNGTRFSDRSD